MTKSTHPVLEPPLRAKVPVPGGGYCLMSGYPGLEVGLDGEAYLDPDAAEAALQDMLAHGANTLIILAEAPELPEGNHNMLRGLVPEGLELHFLPCRDFEVPDASFKERWNALRPTLEKRLAAGGTIAMACQYGAGRSGLLTALVLIEEGATPEAAIATVRRHFHEAVESEIQENWLLAQVPGKKGTANLS
ncbi:hypothetical protein [Pseudooceanicola nanhaiensis]|uniref:protein-tyrosine phosphatase family protein n=1 Tax=Pseudooceanicola nanhaiensis TaxID=375761 RepID=UPI001CD68D42|nr:hypothetical protein [Pseudooceanicola nanhaiensis]MCA0921247.1 hypothetical protein [Pseudooceanicola nanhaiensis]